MQDYGVRMFCDVSYQCSVWKFFVLNKCWWLWAMVGSLENLLIFTVSPDIGELSNITSDIIIFSWKHHLRLHFYRKILLLRRLILWFCMKVWVPSIKQNLTQGLGIAGCWLFDLKEWNTERAIASKVSNGAKIRNRYNQVPHLTQDTNGKVTNSQKTPQTRAKRSALSQQVTKKHI